MKKAFDDKELASLPLHYQFMKTMTLNRDNREGAVFFENEKIIAVGKSATDKFKPAPFYKFISRMISNQD